jgi:hypothetical protein
MQGNCNKAGRPRAEIPRVQMKTPLNFHELIMKKSEAFGMYATDYMELITDVIIKEDK